MFIAIICKLFNYILGASFCVAAGSQTKWLTGELLSLFLFHEMPPMSQTDERSILSSVCGGVIGDKVENVMAVASAIRSSPDPVLANLRSSFSTRQLLRISKRLTSFPGDSLFDTIQKACLARFVTYF